MSRYIELPDGTLMEARKPLDGVPFWSDWTQALLARKAAYTVKEVDRKEGSPTYGQHITIVKPYNRDHEQACEIMNDGSVRIICIGCGGLTEPLMTGFQHPAKTINSGAKALRGKAQGYQTRYAMQYKLAQIFVGALIQHPIIEPMDEWVGRQHVTLLRRWARQSVRKSGMGCVDCNALYAAEVRRVEEDNAARRGYADCLRAVYIQKGDYKAAEGVAQPREYMPFLDVLSRSVTTTQFIEAIERAIT